MLVQNKASYLSKTNLVGFAIALLAGLEALTGYISSVGVEWDPRVMGFIGALMIVLRWMTKQPVSLTGDGATHVDDGTPPRGR